MLSSRSILILRKLSAFQRTPLCFLHAFRGTNQRSKKALLAQKDLLFIRYPGTAAEPSSRGKDLRL